MWADSGSLQSSLRGQCCSFGLKTKLSQENTKKELTNTFSIQQAADSMYCQRVRTAMFVAVSKTTGSLPPTCLTCWDQA